LTLLNPQGKPFSWSYSSLTDFEGCPARYAAKKYYQTTKELPTEFTLWGERVHKAFEERVRDGKAFDPDMPATYEPWARVLEKLPGEKFFEKKFAVRKNHAPCSWSDAQGRGIVDLLILDGDTATIIDYKTGKKKDDQTQLELFSWFVVNEYDFERQFKTLKYRYIWLKDNSTTGGELDYFNAKMVMNRMFPRIEQMQRAWETQTFPMCPSGLCGWCPVEECVHYRRRR
jgi:hypothetical protein